MGQGVIKLADDNNLDLELLPKNVCVRAPRFTLHSQFLAPLVKYGKHSTAQYRRAKWSDVVGAHWRQSLMALYLYSVESLRTWVSGPIFPLSAYVQPHRLKIFVSHQAPRWYRGAAFLPGSYGQEVELLFIWYPALRFLWFNWVPCRRKIDQHRFLRTYQEDL